ncbi:drug/metabolite transporter superfamily [Guyanagaster necrorhizus]|uniref:Drug/metabolite transporter superfamily n=1 Tax=Guyanagaster necrorhizus TaxID=856835 RepID=A0A9P8ANX0_9AGAR|nr:drug/metabolite transporter superfamily [Guyanagaster necrorhizus MCA 3950]KAG7442191.1 drug/metabolite transporter superfamily [Guyanagaster necrorhizus MCA 3950]
MTVGAQDESAPLLPGKITWYNWRFLDRLEKVYKRNTGFLLIAAAQLGFSASDVCVQELNRLDHPVPTLQLIVLRMTITYVCCLMTMLWAGIPEPFRGPEGTRTMLVFRGLCGFVGILGVYYSLKYLSLSEATVLTFLTPFTTTISSAIFLGETVTVGYLVAGLLNIFGVICIAQPVLLFGKSPAEGTEDPEFRLLAVGMSLLGVMGSTGAFTAIRAIGFRAHALHSSASYSLQCVIAASIGMVVTGTPIVIPTQLKWGILFAILVLTGFVGQVFLVMGFQRETAGRGTTALYTQIVFATIIERIFFDYTPNTWSAIGITVIMLAAIYVAVRVIEISHCCCTTNTSADVEASGES